MLQNGAKWLLLWFMARLRQQSAHQIATAPLQCIVNATVRLCMAYVHVTMFQLLIDNAKSNRLYL